MGDSAGANLVMGVVQRAIELSYRKPDSILLIYPCLVIDLNHFSPSYLMALEDPILSAGFLKVCIDSYLSEDTL